MSRVGIVMGSEGDRPVMEKAVAMLAKFGVENELTVISAHRTPGRAADYAKSARGRGVRVIIAGAGMAAHLAGAMAAHCTLPVIGVPLGRSPLQGLDALLSTVQMPPGIPVATVAIDGAANAAMLAVEILALSDDRLRKELAEYRAGLESGNTAG